VIQDWKLQDKIKESMDRNSGDINLAAKELGLTSKTLERKLKRLAGGGADDSPETGEDS